MLSAVRSRLLPASLTAAAAIAAASVSFSETWRLQNSSLSVHADAASPIGLDPNDWRPLKLVDKKQLTHNTYAFRFALPEKDQTAGLKVASCLLAKAPIPDTPDGPPKVVVRPYTPVSSPDTKGHIDLVIKVYPTGKLSKYMGSLKEGDTLDFKGPLAKYPYEPNIKKNIGMVAGGTGITPMLQVVDHILDNPDDKTKVSLLFGNVSEDDIILRDKIDALAAKHPDRFKVFYVVDKPKWGGLFWKGGTGYVTKDMIAQHLPPPADGNLIMVCGPPGLMKVISGDKAKDKSQGPLMGLLKDMGYNEGMVYKF